MSIGSRSGLLQLAAFRTGRNWLGYDHSACLCAAGHARHVGHAPLAHAIALPVVFDRSHICWSWWAQLKSPPQSVGAWSRVELGGRQTEACYCSRCADQTELLELPTCAAPFLGPKKWTKHGATFLHRLRAHFADRGCDNSAIFSASTYTQAQVAGAEAKGSFAGTTREATFLLEEVAACEEVLPTYLQIVLQRADVTVAPAARAAAKQIAAREAGGWSSQSASQQLMVTNVVQHCEGIQRRSQASAVSAAVLRTNLEKLRAQFTPLVRLAR